MKAGSASLFWVALGLGVFVPARAHATYSIIAVDTDSGEMGGLAVSCIGSDFSLSQVVTVREGVGMVASQGYFFRTGRDTLTAALENGASPSAALLQALAPEIDPPGAATGPSFRQYAVVDLNGVSSQHSGASLDPIFGHRAGSVENVVFAVQGNILTGDSVLDDLVAGFEGEGPELPGRLVGAVRAVARSGGGDSRCTPLSGDSAYFAYWAPGRQLVEVERFSPDSEVASLLADGAEEALPPSNPPSEEPGTGAGDDAGCSCRQGKVNPRDSRLTQLGWVVILAFGTRRRPRRSAS